MTNAPAAQSKKPIKFVELVTDSFGFLVKPHGEHIPIKRFTWRNSNRIQVQVITYGATVTSIRYPNKKGIIEDVVLGFEDLHPYLEYQEHHFGSTIGRCANIVKNSGFHLMKKDYNLKPNQGKHHSDGGRKGFHQVIWNHHINGNKVVLSHMSPDDDEGYPGDLLVHAIFELTPSNEFKIEYKATSSKPTIVNLVNHCLFNLAGHAAGEDEIRKHTLMVNADCHTMIGEDLFPTGEIQSVLNTVYDFQTPMKLGVVLDKLEGFNNNLCVNRGIDQGVNFVARLQHPPSGRILEIYSNQYGIQFETANNFPLKSEFEKISANCINGQKVLKTVGSPYLKGNVTTFDILDEIHNKIVDIKAIDPSIDYTELLAVVLDLQKKCNTAYRSAAITDTNSLIKRSALTLENLPVFQLSPLQIRYIERILKSIDSIEDPTYIQPIKLILETTLTNNKVNDAVSNQEKRKNYQEAYQGGKLIRGKKGAKYSKHSAVCLQCQNYPDAINQPKFPSPVLKPGTIYSNITIYKFWIQTDQTGISGILQG